MSQRQALRDLDATLAAAFAEAGFADAAAYVPPGGGTSTDCTVMVDDAVEFFGDDGSGIVGHRTVVALFLAEVAAPARGGAVTLTEDGTVYRLDALVKRDESCERWVVTRG